MLNNKKIPTYEELLDAHARREEHKASLVQALLYGKRRGWEPKTHHLKCQPGPFYQIERGIKRHETRRTDRIFCSGDTVVLQEWSKTHGYSGKELTFIIGAITGEGNWGIPEGFCVFTLLDPNL